MFAIGDDAMGEIDVAIPEHCGDRSAFEILRSDRYEHVAENVRLMEQFAFDGPGYAGLPDGSLASPTHHYAQPPKSQDEGPKIVDDITHVRDPEIVEKKQNAECDKNNSNK